MRAGLAVLLCLVATPGQGQPDDPGPTCDRAAAHAQDPERPAGVPGVPLFRIDPRLAVPACRAASEREPQSGRHAFQLGRALQAQGEADAARQAYARAASLGHGRAHFNLAQEARREGPRQDLPLARRHYREAAERGVREAMTELSGMLNEGEGGPEDAEEARRWLRRAVEAGDAAAMVVEGGLLFIDDDPAGGADLLARAVASGEGDATEAIVAAATALGIDFAGLRGRLRAAVASGDGNATFALARLLEAGIDGPRDAAAAASLLAQAARAGQADALLRMAAAAADRAQARAMLLRAADAGLVPAMSALAEMLVAGAGGPRDLEAGREWYRRAAVSGDEAARRALESLPRP